MTEDEIEQEWLDEQCNHESNGNEYAITGISLIIWITRPNNQTKKRQRNRLP